MVNDSFIDLEKLFHLKIQIIDLPKGSISKKTIRGKDRYYLQWKEEGKTKSKYIKEEELEDIKEKISLRKKIHEEIKYLEKLHGFFDLDSISKEKFTMDIAYGLKLKALCGNVINYEKRDCFTSIQHYLSTPSSDHILLLYGLRRTGKTTLIRQSIMSLNPQEFSHTVYIKANSTNSMNDLNRDLKKLWKIGVRYVYIDEITLLEDFIDGAALLSDIYAPSGMKIICSGTDSLAFYITSKEELYDRCILLHTTYIPFKEHTRVLHTTNIDEYIEYGGTMKIPKKDSYILHDASFTDINSTKDYVDTAISMNIQNSLKHYSKEYHFRHLLELYRKDELINAINRIVENMNHSFLASVLTKDFISNDLHLSNTNLMKDKNLHFSLLDSIDEEAVTKNLMEILNIHNNISNKIKDIDDNVAYEIKEYLMDLDLVQEMKIVSLGSLPNRSFNIITQPGLRYCQAKALVFALLEDKKFGNINEALKDKIIQRILNEIRGRMLEEIVLYDTAMKYKNTKEVFKIVFDIGEYDMAIFDRKNYSISLFEIKHSDKINQKQTRYLRDEELLSKVQKKFNFISRKCVLYMGENTVDEYDIEYKNVSEFLTE